MFGKSMARVGLVTALAIGTPATAQASYCEYVQGRVSGKHSAYVRATPGTCTWTQVRHQYDPVWSNTNYWTNWISGSGSNLYAQTPNTAVLFYIQSRGG